MIMLSFRSIGVAIASSVAFSLASAAYAGTVVLTFEGGGDQATINNFYNGGTDSQGNSGTNYGISFGSDSLSIISRLAGGTGNFEGNPSGKTVAFFLTGPGDTMNIAAGFKTGFSFYYSSAFAGSVNVFSGLNGTGTQLATLALSVNFQNHCAPGATTSFCSWDAQGVTFTGTSQSVIFTGVANEVAFDDITLGSATAGTGQQTLCGPGQTQNQQNVACATDNFVNNGGTLLAGFQNLYNLPPDQLAIALTQLSGEAATGASAGAFKLMDQFLTLMLDPFVDGRGGIGGAGGAAMGFAPEREALPENVALAYAKVLKAPVYKAPTFEQRWNVWGAAFGGYNRTGGDPAVVGSHDLTARAAGLAVGLDYRLARDTVVGFALADGHTGWGLSDGLGGGKSEAFQAGVYGATRSGPFQLAASLAYTNHWMSTDRFAFAGDHLSASFNAQSFGARVEGGYRVATKFCALTPYAALQAQSFHAASYNEADINGGGFALAFGERTASDTRSELGARFDKQIIVDPKMVLALRARLAWAHDWVSDPTLAAVFQALPGASFTVTGATPAKDSALLSAGSELRLGNGVSLAAILDGEFAGRSTTYAGTGRVRVTW